MEQYSKGLKIERLKEALFYNPYSGNWRWINPSKYHSELKDKKAGSVRGTYLWIQLDGNAYSAHRLVFFYLTGNWPSIVDHKNGNTLDNRWINLREASRNQNAWNTKVYKKKSNLPMGVRITREGTYTARIGYYGKQITLGTYQTIKEAQDVYIEKRRELYGEYNRI